MHWSTPKPWRSLPGHRVREALDALRGERAAPIGPVYVVDAQRVPLGQVEWSAVARAAPEARLDTLMTPVPGVLPGVTPLSGAIGHPVWEKADVVPVVERGGGLVGSVQRRTLQGAGLRRADTGEPAPESLAGVLALGYWHAVAALVDALLSLLAPAPRSRP